MDDRTVFRKVMTTEDMVHEFAPALRTSSQSEAFRVALQMLGDLCSIISDTAAEKKQDMAEVGVTLAPWEYRARWLAGAGWRGNMPFTKGKEQP